ncbi:MAG: hypothetical protein EWV48_00770 [Microcystis aeruginosa Ma_QC_C_20070823_S13]|nr:MAG: hypothetical protein EWV56_09740 [Microcystis aeruginosa Ma_QC_C_20070823_S13D]TRU67408.1 MAG: hypothetical protein EWV48_00770 [Microcystis aeruginosa Ma_QC_C_20070823_S13]
MALGNGGVSLELGLISDFITQSKLLGGSTPQTPRRGTKRLPRTPRALVFRWDAYTQLFIYLY